MIQIVPVEGLPEIRAGDDLAALIAGRAELRDRDILVVAHKVVSKAEGRIVDLADVLVGGRAVDAGPLENSRALEAMTAVILNVNREYGITAGLRLTGFP